MPVSTASPPGYAIPLHVRSLRMGRTAWELLLATHRGRLPAPGQPIGLIAELDACRSDTFDPTELHPLLRGFYTETSEFAFQVTREIRGAFRPFARLYHLVSSAVEQLAPGDADSASFVPMDSHLATADLGAHGGLGARIWRRVIGTERRPFYTAVVRPYLGPRRGGGTVTHLHCMFPYLFGHLAVVLEFVPTPGGGLRATSRPADGEGLETGTYVHIAGPRPIWRRVPGAGGERLDFRVEEGRSTRWIRAEHTASLAGRDAMRLGYVIQRRRAR